MKNKIVQAISFVHRAKSYDHIKVLYEKRNTIVGRKRKDSNNLSYKLLLRKLFIDSSKKIVFDRISAKLWSRGRYERTSLKNIFIANPKFCHSNKKVDDKLPTRSLRALAATSFNLL